MKWLESNDELSVNGINQFNGSSSDQSEVSAQSGGKSVFQNVTFRSFY